MMFGRPKEAAQDVSVSEMHIIPYDPTITDEDGQTLPSNEYVPAALARHLGRGFVYIDSQALRGPNLRLTEAELIEFEEGLTPVAERVHARAPGFSQEIRRRLDRNR